MVPLIQPFLLEICQLDTAMTRAAGPGVDDDFQEPIVASIAGRRVVGRYEKAPIFIRVQVEEQAMDQLNAVSSGNTAEAQVAFIAHQRDLRLAGLIRDDGKSVFNVGDRANAIYTTRRKLVHMIPTPPGLYCVEVRPTSYGLDRSLNLLLLRFESRAQGRP